MSESTKTREIKIQVMEYPKMSKRCVKLCNSLHNEFLKNGMVKEDELLSELLDNNEKNGGKLMFIYPADDKLLKEFLKQYLLKKQI